MKIKLFFFILIILISTQTFSQCISGDCINGNGTFIWADGTRYEGYWVNYTMSGYGKMNYSSGATYEGNWVNKLRQGKGTYHYPNGNIYEGDWVNGTQEGSGIFTYYDGGKYEGEWVNNVRQGFGKMIYVDGAQYDGDWVNDKRQGKGVLIQHNGDKYEGEWVSNTFTGKGKKIYSSGKVESGIWSNGNLIQIIVEKEVSKTPIITSKTSMASNSNDNIDLTDSENEEKIRKIIYKVTIDKIVKKDKSNSKVLESRIIKKVETEILLRKATQKDIADIKKNIKYTADLLQLSAAITPKPKVKCDWCNKKIIGKGVNYEVRDGACWISDIYINNYGFNIFCCREHAYKYCNSRN